MKKLEIRNTDTVKSSTLRIEIDSQGFYIGVDYGDVRQAFIRLDDAQIQQVRNFLNNL